MKVKGNLNVAKDITAGRIIEAPRLNSTLLTITNAGTHNLTADTNQWINFSGGTITAALMPDATTLQDGWSITVYNTQAGDISVQNSAAGAIKTVIPGRAYKFTLIDNSTAAGVWYVNFLEEADLIPAERETATFVSGDWNLNGTFYELTTTELAILAGSNHGKGLNPTVKVYEDLTGTHEEVFVDQIIIDDLTGDIELRVSANPSATFDGKVVIL